MSDFSDVHPGHLSGLHIVYEKVNRSDLDMKRSDLKIYRNQDVTGARGGRTRNQPSCHRRCSLHKPAKAPGCRVGASGGGKGTRVASELSDASGMPSRVVMSFAKLLAFGRSRPRPSRRAHALCGVVRQHNWRIVDEVTTITLGPHEPTDSYLFRSRVSVYTQLLRSCGRRHTQQRRSGCRARPHPGGAADHICRIPVRLNQEPTPIDVQSPRCAPLDFASPHPLAPRSRPAPRAASPRKTAVTWIAHAPGSLALLCAKIRGDVDCLSSAITFSCIVALKMVCRLDLSVCSVKEGSI